MKNNDRKPATLTLKDFGIENGFDSKVSDVLKGIEDMLVSKNRSYGNSALKPLNVFSGLSSEESIKVRIDDKLSRIKNSGLNDETEDSLSDLIGYLVLLKIQRNAK